MPRGIRRLTDTVQTLNPTLQYLAPAQTTCNYIALWFRNISSLLSEGDGNGTWQRFIIVATPQGPNNEGGPSAAPADGPTLENHLHTNPYPNTAAPGQPRECEAGNEPYVGGPHGHRQRPRHAAGGDGGQALMARRAAAPRRSPFAVGLIALVVIAILVYLGFTKDIPFTQPLRGQGRVHVLQRPAPGLAGADRRRRRRQGREDRGARRAPTHTVVTMSIEDEGLPLHEDATAKIRPRIFLEGNFFVDLTPGTPGAEELDDGETITVTQTSTPVQLDQVLTALQSDTRQDLHDVLEGLGTALQLRAERGRRPRRRPVRARRDGGGVVERRLRRRGPGRAGAVAGQRGVPRHRARAGPRAG